MHFGQVFWIPLKPALAMCRAQGVFKMRELCHAGKVTVVQIPTKETSADIFTTVLPNQVFAKHRATIHNLAVKPTSPTSSEAYILHVHVDMRGALLGRKLTPHPFARRGGIVRLT